MIHVAGVDLGSEIDTAADAFAHPVFALPVPFLGWNQCWDHCFLWGSRFKQKVGDTLLPIESVAVAAITAHGLRGAEKHYKYLSSFKN